MEISAQDVIDRLTAKIGKLEGEKAVLEAQVEALQYRVEQTHEPQSSSVEGEVV